ncbi:MAG: LLM class flavin-dependent oxidoreductase [Actinobacteria bacterium]|nr:MAG: LLM class flavin-dependent oxidoreductase [Actinomycetota bacterium]
MKFSLWPNMNRPFSEVQELAHMLERDGWDGLWYADHYMPNTTDGATASGDVLECFSVLAGLAASVPRIRLGSLVAPTTVHHPAVLANRAATIDQMSNGRFVLGLGAGWQVNEHLAYGIDLMDPKDRVTRFGEAIEIISRLLSEPRVNFTGKHFTITDAPCEPKPVQQPLPLLVGTGSPRMLRFTARFAQEWNTWGTPAITREVVERLHTACETESRDPTTVHKTTQALVYIVDDANVVEKLQAKVLASRSLVGTTEQLTEMIAEYQKIGIDEFCLPDFTLGKTPAERKETIQRFFTEVASHFRN